MIKLRVNRGNSMVIRSMKGLEGKTRKAITAASFKSGKSLIARAEKEINKKPRFGRVYIVRGPSGQRKRHVASRPGETHANLSGTLRDSLSFLHHGGKRLEFGYGVSTAKTAPKYAQFVEKGTGKMAPRPSLELAVNNQLRNIKKHLIDEIRKELR